jgi:hypothetical protein
MKCVCFLFVTFHLVQPGFAVIKPVVTNNVLTPIHLTSKGLNASLQIAVSANGQALAVWTNTGSEMEIQGYFYDGNNWVPLEANSMFLEDTSTGNALALAFGSAPKVAIDGNGNGIVAYVTPKNQIFVIRLEKHRVLANHSIQLSTPDTSNVSPLVAMSFSGSALVHEMITLN